MTTVTLTEFRSRASDLLNQVERGETIVVLRHGKPIAKVLPAAAAEANSEPSWKKPALRLVTKGTGLSEAILAERNQ